MNLFDQYGIKEVADVTIYSIHKKEDNSGEVYYVPALYLDTLKVTSTEKTASNTWAQGGVGNSRLISWDYDKQINITLEDALCTPASLGLCWGGVLSSDWKDAQVKHQYGINDASSCGGSERISRMEKSFYPRNDTINAVISNLLPRDGKEDILPDINGDPIYLQRSSVLDGTDVRGFGYVDGHPYKWRLEIETAVKSVAVVPDRFFSIYGKSYPIKRRQTVGINQPSNAFKYEIIYLRGYDVYNDEGPHARIIYHKQAEQNIGQEFVCESDNEALNILDDFDGYPYLKLRVCLDGSVRAYLGKKEVGWDYTRQIGENVADHANENEYWVEIPQINTEQFRGIDLWLRFDSINALSYYILTKYESNIFSIGPKVIKPGIDRYISKFSTEGESQTFTITIPADATYLLNGKLTSPEKLENWEITVNYGNSKEANEYITFGSSKTDAQLNMLKKIATDEERINSYSARNTAGGSGSGGIEVLDITSISKISSVSTTTIDAELSTSLSVDEAVGNDYGLETPSNVEDINNPCIPCCKKTNLSRSIWAYVNPKTMTPYDDDYWFHQGEPYYKKSLTISTKDAPIKAKKIVISAGDFPGMYKIVGETLIRSRDTGEDERVQLEFPLCKIKSDQSLTLQSDGDPTTFNLDVEVAVPPNGHPMIMTFYEVEKEMKQGCSGSMIEKDGSTRISAR